MITAYVSIGNSDDKLTQSHWAGFISNVRTLLRRHAQAVHGEWYSAPDASYQNACFCVDFRDADKAEYVKMRLREFRDAYYQDSVAFAVAETEFL